MENFNYPYIQAASQFSQFCNPKKTIRVFLSLSVLSILVSFSSVLPFLLHSFPVYISTFPMKLFGYTISKNYMFLLCNGLLVFIVKNSGLVGNSHSGYNLTNEEHVIKNELRQQSAPEVLSENNALDHGSKHVLMEVEEEQVTANGFLITVAGGEHRLLTMQDEDDEECKDLIVIEEEEEEEEEEGFGLLSTEELNKRCEEFIRKVKEEIKFGAQQLILV